jgi:hypothetical protein
MGSLRELFTEVAYGDYQVSPASFVFREFQIRIQFVPGVLSSCVVPKVKDRRWCGESDVMDRVSWLMHESQLP